jgi:hypothetical protein
MFRHFFLLIALVLILFPAHSDADRPAPNDPGDAQLVTTDIDHFWEAFDAMADGDTVAALQSLYFDRASPGLKDFIRLRIQSVEELMGVINAHPLYYASLREGSMKVASMESDIRKSFRTFKDLYPDAHFPNVYFLIGRMNSGGTASDMGLLIGMEMYGLCEGTPREELGEWHQQVLMCIDGLPHIVAHELIHFEQPPIPNDQRTLLAQTVHEGSADFLGELISGRHINGHIHEYCLPREAELWAEFKEEMNGTDIGGWMYGGQPEGRPADIGYFFGYRIAEAYYNQADDKKKAIRDILLIDDFNEFLAASGYAP